MDINGIIPINKSRGMTSHDVVAVVRGILHTKKVGHSGTLDPNVDGVLPICVGRATKVVDFLMSHGKVYRGSITLGFSTTTEDLDGEVVEQKHLKKKLSDSEINHILSDMTGELIQIPPMYSAVKVKGRKLYEYARAGESVERPKRKITVSKFIQTKPSVFDEQKQQQTIFFEVHCGKGTYVRTLAVDFGKKINMPAVMSDLTRVQSGGFSIDECITLKQLEELRDNDKLDQAIFSLERALPQFKTINLNDNQWQIVKNGGFIKLDLQEKNIKLKYNDQIQAIYKYDDNRSLYIPKKMLLVR